MVLNHFPGNAGDVGGLPCKHIDIRLQESDERAFLFFVEGGAYGESPSRAILLDGYPLGFWWCSSTSKSKKSRAEPPQTKKVSVWEDGTGGAFTISSTLDSK